MATIASLTLKRALRMHGPVGVVLQEVRREPLKRIGGPLDAQLGQSLCQNGDKAALAFQIQLCLSWRHWGGRRHYLPNIPCACVSSGFWRKGGARRLLRKLVKQWSLQLAGALCSVCTAKQVSRKFTRFTGYFNCIFCQLGLNSCDM